MRISHTMNYKTIALILMLLGFVFAGSVQSQIVLNPTDDTFIDEIAPSDINGSLAHLVVRCSPGWKLDVLLNFDLSSIPGGTSVASATLKLYYSHWNDMNPAGRSLNAHHITSAWSEAAVNWNTRPSYNATPFSSGIVPASADNWLDIDVTAEVQAIIDGAIQNYGWQIKDPGSGNPMIYFYAKENGDSIPRLEIETAEIDYWKPPHPNYAPSGMPDFDMKQDAWKTLYPGPNGVLDSPLQGDDVYGSVMGPVIAAGPNCHLDTEPTGDDYTDWSFSGPAALANCFWWFDSKFGNPSGYPGDGVDDFPLVEGYSSSGKIVDQEQTMHDTYIDLVPYYPGHVQSFIPSVAVLDAVQIMLRFAYPGTYDDIQIAIYDMLPDNPGVTPIGTSLRTITGPWADRWYQFHFDPQIVLMPGATYYIGVVDLSGGGNAHWCYSPTNPYLPGMAYQCWDDYTLIPSPDDDFTFKTEYYDSGTLDDHDPANVPYLIEDLAYRICVCTEGYSDINAMQIIIDEWFTEKGLSSSFVENTYTAPDFEFIEAEIERSQDVILLLGFYGAKLVDQQQTLWDYRVDLYPWPPGHLQEFTPSVSVLDAVQLLLQADTVEATTVEVSIYNTLPNNPYILPLGIATRVVSVPWYPEWFQFHFEPPINLTPGSLYYIAAKTLDVQNNVEWCYATDDLYTGGVPWKNWDDYSLMSEPYEDFAFKTEYYEADSCARIGQRYVTCAGVNSDQYLIAFSDPYYDISDGAMGNVQDHPPHPYDGTFHNDAQYVSHDIYSIITGSPCPGPSQWWIPGYPAGFKFTIVEAAIVICPVEGPTNFEYLPGDVNMKLGLWPPMVVGGDVTYLVNYFKGLPTSVPCLKHNPAAVIAPTYFWASADANGDCVVMGSDVVRLVAYFRGIGIIQTCSDYPPAYPPIPPTAPTGWPNCP